MKNQSDALRSYPVTWEELRTLRDSIPLYSSWNFQELQQIFECYRLMLIPLSMTAPYDRPLQTQVQNIERIRKNVEAAMVSGHYVPYNRATIELVWDIEAVMEVLLT